MEKQSELAVLEELQCPVCDYYMCPPIFLCIEGHSICENCFRRVEICPKCRGPKNNAARNYALEAIHAKLNIPCKYAISGCDIVLQGEYIKQHQRICTYSSILCPFRYYDNCQWKQHRRDLKSHLENNHSLNFYSRERQKFISRNFMAINNDHFIYIVIYAHHQFFRLTWDVNEVTGMTRWAVYFIGSPDAAKAYSYELDFSKARKGNEALSPPLKFESVCGPNPEQDNVKFEDHQCFYAHKTLLNKYCNDDGGLNYKVTIYNLKHKHCDMEKQSESGILEELRCPVCDYYMCPPIFLCIEGHGICEDCFKRVEICPKCGSKSNGGRNYTLEAIHAKLNIPCKYIISGCDIVLQGEYIKQHQRVCTFTNILFCPFRYYFNCQWKQHRGNLKSHLKKKHSLNFYLRERQKFLSRNFIAINTYHFIYVVIYAHLQFFRLTWDINEVTGMTRWAVYFIGSPEAAKTYAYKLDFYKARKGDEALPRPLKFESLCGPKPEQDNVKFEDHQCFYAHKTLLNKYCNDDGGLNYTVTIYNLKLERVRNLGSLFGGVKLVDD